MNKVIIAIGSNIGDPVAQVKQAINALHQLPQSKVLSVSSLYSSTPMGSQEQPDYINAVTEIETSLEPLALLDLTQEIEKNQGRVRKKDRWGPRTLDLDIILFGNHIINNERLTVPHYGMKEREFVLYPLAEICDDLQLPDGTKLSELLNNIDKNNLTIWQ